LNQNSNKIYLVLTPFFPSKSNFRGPYVLDQVKAIKETSNYNVKVLKPKALFSKLKDYEFEGVKVYYFRRVVLPSNILPGLFKGLSKFLFFKKLNDLDLNINNIAVVHAHVTENGFYANSLKAQQSNIITVLQHHGFDVLSLGNGVLSRFNWHRNWVKRYGVRICNAIDLHLGVSAKTLDFVSAIPEISMKNQYVLYNGIDRNKFYAIDGLKDTSKMTIGCIANFWPLKDQITLIKAAEQLIEKGIKQLKVVFIGSGELLDFCKAYVGKNNLEHYIIFRQEMKHQELCKFYNSLDLFVMPSYYEAFGCVYTEAYACGVPFVGVQDQGIAELISQEDQHLWLIEPRNVKQLVGVIAHYFKERPKQQLNSPIDITTLVKDYLNYLKSLKVA